MHLICFIPGVPVPHAGRNRCSPSLLPPSSWSTSVHYCSWLMAGSLSSDILLKYNDLPFETLLVNLFLGSLGPHTCFFPKDNLRGYMSETVGIAHLFVQVPHSISFVSKERPRECFMKQLMTWNDIWQVLECLSGLRRHGVNTIYCWRGRKLTVFIAAHLIVVYEVIGPRSRRHVTAAASQLSSCIFQQMAALSGSTVSCSVNKLPRHTKRIFTF